MKDARSTSFIFQDTMSRRRRWPTMPAAMSRWRRWPTMPAAMSRRRRW